MTQYDLILSSGARHALTSLMISPLLTDLWQYLRTTLRAAQKHSFSHHNNIIVHIDQNQPSLFVPVDFVHRIESRITTSSDGLVRSTRERSVQKESASFWGGERNQYQYIYINTHRCTIAQRNFWKSDRLVASLLRRSHVEPLRGVFRDDDGFVSIDTLVPLVDQEPQYAAANSERLSTAGQQKTVSIV